MPIRLQPRQILFLAILCLAAPSAETQDCSGDPALQILGSGGPIADDERASSGYLLWRGGKAVALIDAGGGTFQRFGASGAALETLELIAITHVHTDHAADLPALLKGAYFSKRTRDLPIAGPTGNAQFPGLNAYLESLFNADRGAFRYLSGLLDGSGRLFRLDRLNIDRQAREPVSVLESEGMNVAALGVHHGPVPSLAYRFDFGDIGVVISGDQNLSTDGFIQFAADADVLVMPFAIPEDAGRVARNLHATPSAIGKAAAQAGAEHLVLSHFMARSLRNLDAQLEHVRSHYKGPVTLAEDLACIALADS